MDRKKKGIRKCNECGEQYHGCWGSGRSDGYGYDHCIIKDDSKPETRVVRLCEEDILNLKIARDRIWKTRTPDYDPLEIFTINDIIKQYEEYYDR